jgi:hypothetical protein
MKYTHGRVWTSDCTIAAVTAPYCSEPLDAPVVSRSSVMARSFQV